VKRPRTTGSDTLVVRKGGEISVRSECSGHPDKGIHGVVTDEQAFPEYAGRH